MFSIDKTCDKTCNKLSYVMRFIIDLINADWIGEFIMDEDFNHIEVDEKTKIRIESIRDIMSDIDDPIARAKVELAHPDIDAYYRNGHKCTSLYSIRSQWDNFEMVNNLSGLFKSRIEFDYMLRFAIELLEDNNQIYIDWGYEGIEGVGFLSDIDNVIE